MDWRQFAVHLASMARGFVIEDTVDDTLEKITGAAVALVDGCDAAGILMAAKGRRMETLAPTDALVVESDSLQYTHGEGPCFDAARLGHPVFRIEDVSTEDVRWRNYAPAAHALGIGSMMGFLLYTADRENLGALNLYSHRPGAFTQDSETAGWLLATHAAAALSGAREHAQMQSAIDSRHVIGEAMGILMTRHALSENAAFDVLRRYSQEKNLKLREIARQVCEEATDTSAPSATT